MSDEAGDDAPPFTIGFRDEVRRFIDRADQRTQDAFVAWCLEAAWDPEGSLFYRTSGIAGAMMRHYAARLAGTGVHVRYRIHSEHWVVWVHDVTIDELEIRRS
ncbi:MAG: hypothetical protein S0880_18835 [Actinomycetota bacterium]|nr:hypothetical protein [Actinomycetota bacterium]